MSNDVLPVMSATDESRQALFTLKCGVHAVADALRRWTTLERHAYRAHRGALEAFHEARHHALEGQQKECVERLTADLANRLDWPSTSRSGSPPHRPQRPLTKTEIQAIGEWAGTSHSLAVAMLDLMDHLDYCHGAAIVTAAKAAREVFPRVTVAAHKAKAEKLMKELDRFCADERVAWVFEAAECRRRSLSVLLGSGLRWRPGRRRRRRDGPMRADFAAQADAALNPAGLQNHNALFVTRGWRNAASSAWVTVCPQPSPDANEYAPAPRQ